MEETWNWDAAQFSTDNSDDRQLIIPFTVDTAPQYQLHNAQTNQIPLQSSPSPLHKHPHRVVPAEPVTQNSTSSTRRSGNEFNQKKIQNRHISGIHTLNNDHHLQHLHRDKKFQQNTGNSCGYTTMVLLSALLILSCVILLVNFSGSFGDDEDHHHSRYRTQISSSAKSLHPMVEMYHSKISSQQKKSYDEAATEEKEAEAEEKDNIIANKDSCPVGFELASQDGKSGTKCTRRILSPSAVDPQMQDISVSPCENFYKYSCGAFSADTRNQGKDSTFRYLYEKNRELMRSIILKVSLERFPDESLVSSFYHSCVAHSGDKRDARIYQLLVERIDSVVKDYEGLSRILGELQRYDLILPIELDFELDPLRGKHLLPTLTQSGLFDTRAHITSSEHFELVFKRILDVGAENSKQAQEDARQVILIEKAISDMIPEGGSRTLMEYVLEGGEYERNDLAENWTDGLEQRLQRKGFSLELFFRGACPADSVNCDLWMRALRSRPLWCHSVSYLERLPDLFSSFSLRSWRVYLKHALMFHLSPGGVGTQAIDEESHFSYHRTYDSRYSLPWLRPRRFLPVYPLRFGNEQDDCVDITEAYLPVILDNYFLRVGLEDDSIKSASYVVERVRDTFVEMLNDKRVMSYLSDDDREEALRKITETVIQIGAPSNWPLDRSDLQLDAESFSENLLRIRRYHSDKTALLFTEHTISGTPLHPDELFDGLVSVANAFYQHQLNTVTLNAGVLSQPVFSSAFDEVNKYSRLGVFAAHELSHSLDRAGSNFDSNGTLRQWMSQPASREYKKRLGCFVNLYDVITDKGTQHNGMRTLDENVADITAIHVAYESLFGKASNSVDSIEQKKQFFLSYAQLYCESLSLRDERSMVLSRTHSLGELRVNNVVSQVADFADVWKCSSDEMMSQRKQCSII